MPMPDLRSSLPSTYTFAKNFLLPHAGTLPSTTVWNQRIFLGEICSNFRFFRFGSDWCAFDVHLRQCLLSIQGYLWFVAPPLRLSARGSVPRFMTAVLLREGSSLHAISSIILPALIVAPAMQLIPPCSAPRLSRCPDSVCDTLMRQGTIQVQPSARPDYLRACKPHSTCSSS